MLFSRLCCGTAARPLLASLLLAPGACPWAAEGESPGSFRPKVNQEVSVGGMVRVDGRDPGLIGSRSGGTGTSDNFDDGNLNYDRGLTALGVQGRTRIEATADAAELKLDVAYFYDFINADGKTDFLRLSDEARDRAGRYLYLGEAYAGYRFSAAAAALGVRLGNQILRWSDSPAFGYSIAPVNPVSASRRYQPGNTAADYYVALPMLSAKAELASRWTIQGFYLLGFEPTETEAAGTFLAGNDYYSPGGRFVQLRPDVSQFGSIVPRADDREPRYGGQFGIRVETPELGAAKSVLAGYAMRVHAREPIVSVNTGTLGGLLGVTAPDYTSSGNYFVEYVPDVTILGGSMRAAPATHTRLNFDYAIRFKQPLQVDDEILIEAGLAPAAVIGTCVPVTPLCAGTLATLNRNPLIAKRGGITAANAASFFATEISGYERFDVSQYSLSMGQGLPPVLGARQWYFAGEAGGIYIHGFKERFLDASVSVRPNAAGGRREGFATRSAWGYRLYSRLDYANVLGMQRVSPSIAWIQDVAGNAPITFGTLLEGTQSLIVAADMGIRKSLGARVSYRKFYGKGNDADRFSDRDFATFSLTRHF